MRLGEASVIVSRLCNVKDDHQDRYEGRSTADMWDRAEDESNESHEDDPDPERRRMQSADIPAGEGVNPQKDRRRERDAEDQTVPDAGRTRRRKQDDLRRDEGDD